MSDTDFAASQEPQPDEEKQGRSYETLGTILLIVTVIVVALLLWRSCSTEQSSGATSGGGAVIQSLEGLETVEGAVSIWAAPDADVEAILARNGLSGAAATDFGEGTWVVEVGDIDLAETVERLKADPDLKDAGYLYHDATAK